MPPFYGSQKAKIMKNDRLFISLNIKIAYMLIVVNKISQNKEWNGFFFYEAIPFSFAGMFLKREGQDFFNCVGSYGAVFTDCGMAGFTQIINNFSNRVFADSIIR